MKTRFFLLPLLCLPLAGQVKFDRGSDRVRIEIGGKVFSDFVLGQDSGKPYLAPLRSASGKVVTRGFPMEKIAGESNDHPHQRGVFFAFEDVNGVDFWNNELNYTTKNRGRAVLDKIVEMKGGKHSGVLRARFLWNDPEGKRILTEDRTMTFFDDPKNRIVDFDITLTAGDQRVVFGDAKDGAFGIRIADALREEKNGGLMVNAEGKRGEPEVWGKHSNWVDYSGTVDGEKLGIAIFDNPGNPGHAPRWHSRGYGLFAVNPFGNHVFDKNAPAITTPLEAGKSMRYRWRVVVHPGDTASADIAALYAQYAK
jgi:hypothetical protein